MPKLVLTILLLVCLSVSAQESSVLRSSCAIPVGGGKITDAFLTEIVSYSRDQSPRLLVIPFASRTERGAKNSGEKYANRFRAIGVDDVSILDTSDREQALEDIEKCTMIWMPGGSQGYLARALEKVDLLQAVRGKVRTGILIGGTSAGASIMSEVMMSHTEKDKESGESHPVISHGLGNWPGTIIDQHFSQRNRLWRLKEAISLHPGLIGIGLDESTAVVRHGGKNRFTVIGSGTVSVVRKTSEDSPVTVEVLSNGDVYEY